MDPKINSVLISDLEITLKEIFPTLKQKSIHSISFNDFEITIYFDKRNIFLIREKISVSYARIETACMDKLMNRGYFLNLGLRTKDNISETFLTTTRGITFPEEKTFYAKNRIDCLIIAVSNLLNITNAEIIKS